MLYLTHRTSLSSFFFFTATATTEIYTLSYTTLFRSDRPDRLSGTRPCWRARTPPSSCVRSEEHTSELQSHSDLVCRLLLEKKKNLNSSYIDQGHTTTIRTVYRLTVTIVSYMYTSM